MARKVPAKSHKDMSQLRAICKSNCSNTLNKYFVARKLKKTDLGHSFHSFLLCPFNTLYHPSVLCH